MTSYDISLDNLSVCIGMPSSRDINPYIVRSLFATQGLCFNLNIPCELAMVAGSAIVQWARDEVIDLFLQTKANRLFCIDSDIIWEAEQFMRLLALSQEREVVCATYTAKIDQPTYYIRYDESKPLKPDKYGLVEIMGTGLGFTVIRREVIEKLVEEAPKIYDEITGRKIASIFDVGSIDGKRKGEDMDFFAKINKLGYKIYLDASIGLGHVGTKVYNGNPMEVLGIINAG